MHRMSTMWPFTMIFKMKIFKTDFSLITCSLTSHIQFFHTVNQYVLTRNNNVVADARKARKRKNQLYFKTRLTIPWNHMQNNIKKSKLMWIKVTPGACSGFTKLRLRKVSAKCWRSKSREKSHLCQYLNTGFNK